MFCCFNRIPMHKFYWVFLVFWLIWTTPASSIAPNDHLRYNYYAVELDSSEDFNKSDLDQRINQFAEIVNAVVVSQIGELHGHYLVAVEKNPLNTNQNDHIHQHLLKRADESPDIKWTKQMIPKKRLFKREYIHLDDELQDITYPFSKHSLNERDSIPSRLPLEDAQKIWDNLGITDPGFPDQWHLVRNSL